MLNVNFKWIKWRVGSDVVYTFLKWLLCVGREEACSSGQGWGQASGVQANSIWSGLFLCEPETGALLVTCQIRSSSGCTEHSGAPLKCDITVAITQLLESNVHRHALLLRLMLLMRSETLMTHNDIHSSWPNLSLLFSGVCDRVIMTLNMTTL